MRRHLVSWGVALCLINPTMAAAPDVVRVGPTTIRIQAGVGDESDRVVVESEGATQSAPLNRSRGVEDAVRVDPSGEILLAGVWMKTPGEPWHRAKQGARWLGSGITLMEHQGQTELLWGRRRCQVRLPKDWSPVDEPRQSNPRWVAVDGDKRVLLLVEARPTQKSTKRLPIRVDLTSCRQEMGEPLDQPGFDARLSGFRSDAVMRYALWSVAEGVLQVSRDGLTWTRLPLPDETHALLSVHAEAGTLWVAVSDATRDFATAYFRLNGGGDGAWQQTTSEDIPASWWGARILRDTRLVP